MTDCTRCGVCCRKGGPALRREDLDLVRQGHISHARLVTIRRGELGFNPAAGRLEPVPVELVKVSGTGGEWTCVFLEAQTNSCTIYAHRPMGCKILRCRRPEAALAGIYKNTASRTDLLNANDPVLRSIEHHERECPAREFTTLLAGCSLAENITEQTLQRITALIRKDLAIRAGAAAALGLPAALEFFLLGRPFFKQLAGSALHCSEAAGQIHVRPVK